MNNEIYTLQLNTEQLNIVMQALSEIPAKFSMKVILEIENQVRPQIQQPKTLETK